MTSPDFSPSAERNKHPILEILRSILASNGRALEIASGTGQHVEWFAQQLPQWTWQPTDIHQGALYNIEMRCEKAQLENVSPPMQLDVSLPEWPLEEKAYELVLCINMLHIAPWKSCNGLMQGCGRHLTRDGLLVTYGPYFEDGVTPAPTNVAFDQSLREHDPSWGIRRREDVEAVADACGLRLQTRYEMPANNLLLVFSRIADNSPA